MSDNIIILADRVKETSWTTGSGNFELAGAANGFSSFDSQYSDGDILFYAATNGMKYEVGSGIFTVGQTANSIVRMPFRTSETNNSKVDFNTGAKEVYATYPATHSVYIGSGVADLNFPQSSGIAFWSSANILNYDSDVIWDAQNKRLGIKRSLPEYGVDVGGYGIESSVQASGFYVGESGVVFPSANNGDINYSGGSQLVHFDPNELDSNTLIDQVIELGGSVNNIFLFKKQPEGTFLAGPGSGTCSGPCQEEYPVFRMIDIGDIPDLSSLYASSSELSSVSGILNNALLAASGDLNAQIISSSGNLQSFTEDVSGVLSESITETYRTIDVTESLEKFVFNNVGLNGASNPSIRLYKGMKYIFNVNAPGYPFYIKSSPTLGGGSEVYNSGVTNNGDDVGEIVFTVPQESPDRLFYSSSLSDMSGVIFTSDLNLKEHNDYDYINSVDTEASDSVVLWDSSEMAYKNISLGNLLHSPSGNSYVKYETVGSSEASGETGEVSFDDQWAYFKTGDGWKRVRIQTFQTTLEPTTTTTFPPQCTTPSPCNEGEIRIITGTISDGGDYDGCPIYSECQTTTTTSTTTTTTTTPAPEPTYNSVFTWGYNGHFQLGYPTSREFSQVITQIEATNIVQMSASDFHVLALDSIGRIFAWGWNSEGQIGDGSKIDSLTPKQIRPNTVWKEISAGSYHSAAISTNGELYTWGSNSAGQLGNGTRISHIVPTKISNLKNWEKVFCGAEHTIAINTLGEMYAFGSNKYGQLGDGSFSDSLSPKKTAVGYLWNYVSTHMHTLGITKEGQLLSWGRNLDGQLGIATREEVVASDGSSSFTISRNDENVNIPTPISKIDTFEIDSPDAIFVENAGIKEGWRHVSAGFKHSIAINSAGELFTCGTNSFGALAIGDGNAGLSLPAFYRIGFESNWTHSSAGNYHSLFVDAADNIFGAGRNNRGQLLFSQTTQEMVQDLTSLSSDYDWSNLVTGYDFSAAVGNVQTTQTTTSTTTTGAPMIDFEQYFTSSILFNSLDVAEDLENNISAQGVNLPTASIHYNVPLSKGHLPIVCNVYKSNVLLMSLTVTSGYLNQVFGIRILENGGSVDYTFTATDGRVDL
jgi:alpha-tubulin suppressor-like RCC1 family protein